MTEWSDLAVYALAGAITSLAASMAALTRTIARTGASIDAARTGELPEKPSGPSS